MEQAKGLPVTHNPSEKSVVNFCTIIEGRSANTTSELATAATEAATSTRTDKRFTPTFHSPPLPFPGPSFRRCRVLRLNRSKAVTAQRKSLNPVVFQVYPTKAPTFVGLDLGRDPVELKDTVIFYGPTTESFSISPGSVPPANTPCFALTKDELESYCPMVNIRDQGLIPTQVSFGADVLSVDPPTFAIALQCVAMYRGSQYWFAVLVSWTDAHGVYHSAISDAFVAVSHCINQRKERFPMPSSPGTVVCSSAQTRSPRQQHPKQRNPCPYCLKEGVNPPWQHTPKSATMLLDEKQRNQALQKAWMKHYRETHKTKGSKTALEA